MLSHIKYLSVLLSVVLYCDYSSSHMSAVNCSSDAQVSHLFNFGLHITSSRAFIAWVHSTAFFPEMVKQACCFHILAGTVFLHIYKVLCLSEGLISYSQYY